MPKPDYNIGKKAESTKKADNCFKTYQKSQHLSQKFSIMIKKLLMYPNKQWILVQNSWILHQKYRKLSNKKL